LTSHQKNMERLPRVTEAGLSIKTLAQNDLRRKKSKKKRGRGESGTRGKEGENVTHNLDKSSLFNREQTKEGEGEEESPRAKTRQKSEGSSHKKCLGKKKEKLNSVNKHFA